MVFLSLVRYFQPTEERFLFLIVAAIPFILYAVHDKQGQKLNADLEHIKPHTIHSDHFFIHPRARSTHHVIVDGVNTTHS